MFRRQRHISRQAMLESVPVLNPAVRWQELDTGRIMVVYRKEARGIRRWAMRLLAMPETGQVLLDDTGTKVVRQIDGRRSVADLIAYVRDELKLSRKESEVSLLKFMELLGRRRLIGFAVRAGGEGN